MGYRILTLTQPFDIFTLPWDIVFWHRPSLLIYLHFHGISYFDIDPAFWYIYTSMGYRILTLTQPFDIFTLPWDIVFWHWPSLLIYLHFHGISYFDIDPAFWYIYTSMGYRILTLTQPFDIFTLPWDIVFWHWPSLLIYLHFHGISFFDIDPAFWYIYTSMGYRILTLTQPFDIFTLPLDIVCWHRPSLLIYLHFHGISYFDIDPAFWYIYTSMGYRILTLTQPFDIFTLPWDIGFWHRPSLLIYLHFHGISYFDIDPAFWYIYTSMGYRILT